MRNGTGTSGIVAMGAALAALLLSGPAAAQDPPLSGILGVSVIGEPIDDQFIAVCAGQVPATCYFDATGLTMDLGTGEASSTRDFTGVSGQAASFGQTEFFFRGAHPLAVPKAGFLSVAGFSFELTSYQLDYQDVGVIYVDGRGILRAPGFAPTPGIMLVAVELSPTSYRIAIYTDRDDDGIADADDNCPRVANPDQSNIDGDLRGDACDPDADGDGVENDLDNCPLDGNGGRVDGSLRREARLGTSP